MTPYAWNILWTCPTSEHGGNLLSTSWTVTKSQQVSCRATGGLLEDGQRVISKAMSLLKA